VRQLLCRVKRLLELRRDIEELRDRVEYVEDSVAAFIARAKRNERTLRPWAEVRRTSSGQRS